MNRFRFIILILCFGIAPIVFVSTGCEKKQKTVRRYFEKRPLEGIPTGADLVFQVNLEKILGPENQNPILDQGLSSAGQLSGLEQFQKKYSFDPQTDLKLLTVGVFGIENMNSMNWIAVAAGNFNEFETLEKIKQAALIHEERDYSDLNYYYTDEGAITYSLKFLTSREAIVSSDETIFRRVIELYKGGTDYVFNDQNMGPLLKKISSSSALWLISKANDEFRAQIKNGLLLIEENAMEYPIDNIESYIIDIALVDKTITLNFWLIFDTLENAELLKSKFDERLGEWLNILSVQEQNMGGDHISITSLLANLKTEVEGNAFKLPYTIDEKSQELIEQFTVPNMQEIP